MLSALYPPFIGGVEQHVRNLARTLAQRGHDVTVATMAAPDLPELEDDGGARVHRIRSTAGRLPSLSRPQGQPHAPPFPDPEVVRALRAIVAAERPEIVHAHDWMVRSYLPMKSASHAPLVLTLHNYGVVCAKLSFIYKGRLCSGPGMIKCLSCAADNYGTARGMMITLGNWAMQPWQRSAVDMFLPVSDAVASYNELAARGLPYEVIPNFIPDDVAERWDAGDSAQSALPDAPYWLYVGALSKNKGVHVLLDAYAGLPEAPPLVMIGPRWHDTPSRFPPKITVLPSLPHVAVMAAWRRASIGIVPSIFPDPCPTVAMEAMACGVPVVASRIGGLPDLVEDGETGLLVEAGDPGQLREALARLSADSPLASRMGEAALLKVRSFTAGTVIDRLEVAYGRLVELVARR